MPSWGRDHGVEGAGRHTQPAIIAALYIQIRRIVRVQLNDGPYLAHASREAAPAGAAEAVIYLQTDIAGHGRYV